jgi:hypothetical protein
MERHRSRIPYQDAQACQFEFAWVHEPQQGQRDMIQALMGPAAILVPQGVRQVAAQSVGHAFGKGVSREIAVALRSLTQAAGQFSHTLLCNGSLAVHAVTSDPPVSLWR